MTGPLENLPVAKLSPEEIQKRQQAVAMKQAEHMKRWLLASNRRYFIFKATDLHDALEPLWPEGHIQLQNFVNIYAMHRMGIPSGDTEMQQNPVTGEAVPVPLMKLETLTVPEMDRCIRFLIGQITDQDPTWKLENAPL